MTIKDCIDIIDSTKPNQYTITDKVRWLSFIEEIIINDVLKTHEGYDGGYDDFTGYSDNKISVALIVPSPYDRLYTAYLKMKIDEENGETARYNNSAAMFNAYLSEYKKYYNKTHMPLSNVRIREIVKNKANQTKGLTDAEMENLKNELTFILTEYFSNTISDDKVYDVVTKYMQNNVQLLKGKDGNTPIKGQDYFTEADIKAITDKLSSYAKNEIQIMAKDFADILSEINSKYNNLSSVVENKLPNKVDKEEGKGLSEQNYTTSDKQLLYSNNRQISELENSMAYKVDATPGKGLSSNDYTAEDKALLHGLETQISGKVDKEFGKGLSTEDYTTEEKKLLSELDNDMGDVDEALREVVELQNKFIDGNYVVADQTYDPTSKNAQSGIAVAEAIANIDVGVENMTIDQSYNPISENAQSGIAVAQSIKSCLKLGNNLYSISDETKGYISVNGDISPITNELILEKTSGYISVTEGSKYAFQIWVKVPEGQQLWMAYYFYDSAKRPIGSRVASSWVPSVEDGISYSYLTFTAPSDTAYIRVSGRSFGNAKFKVEEGSPTEYVINPRDVINNSGVAIYDYIDYDATVKAINHRGYNTVAPENTLSAFKLSKQMGFKTVEADILFTSDNVPVILHDVTIDRTSNGTGNISSMTLEEVRQYDFGSWKSDDYAGEKIPTLEELLKLCKEIGLNAYLELKQVLTEAQANSVIGLVEKYGMKECVSWISYSYNALEGIKNIDSRARLLLLCSEITDNIITSASNLKTDYNEVGIDAYFYTVTDEMVQKCMNTDIPLEVYCPNYEVQVIGLNPYITGVTSDSLIAGKVLYEANDMEETPSGNTTFTTPEYVNTAMNTAINTAKKYTDEKIAQTPTSGSSITLSELANFTLEEEVNNITVPLSDNAFNYRSILIYIDTQVKTTGQYWMYIGDIDNMTNTKKTISHMNGALDAAKHASHTMIDFFKNYCFSSAVEAADYQYNSTPKQFMYPLVYRSFVANAIQIGTITFPVGTTIKVEGVM